MRQSELPNKQIMASFRKLDYMSDFKFYQYSILGVAPDIFFGNLF